MRKLFTLIAVTFIAIAAQAGGPVTINVKADVAPFLYVWDQDENKLNGEWPGTQMTETTEVNGVTVWTQTFSIGGDDVINIIFNNGNGGEGNQTADIGGLACETVNNYTYDGATEYEAVEGFEEEGGEEEGYVPQAVEGEIALWFETTRAEGLECHTWAWADGKTEAEVLGVDPVEWATRPAMTLDGEIGEDKVVYKYVYAAEPSGFVVTYDISGEEDHRLETDFVNNGYFVDGEGLKGIVSTDGGFVTAINAVSVKAEAQSNAMYNLAGQRVNKNYKGVVIMNGKKFMNK